MAAPPAARRFASLSANRGALASDCLKSTESGGAVSAFAAETAQHTTATMVRRADAPLKRRVSIGSSKSIATAHRRFAPARKKSRANFGTGLRRAIESARVDARQAPRLNLAAGWRY